MPKIIGHYCSRTTIITRNDFRRKEKEQENFYDGESAPVRRYLNGIGLSYVQTLEDGLYHACHQDEHGSTVYITEEGRQVQNSYRYDAFGNLLERKEAIENRILYTGQQYDQVTGQYYLRARYYNPVVGRFLQEDTYRGDGLNLYAYCVNNPEMYYDPSGHTCEGNTSPTDGTPGGNTVSDINSNSGKYQVGAYQDIRGVEGMDAQPCWSESLNERACGRLRSTERACN